MEQEGVQHLTMTWRLVAVLAPLLLTAALVGVTAWYASQTRKIAEHNEQLAEATERLAKASADSLLLQTVPVLSPRFGGPSVTLNLVEVKGDIENVGKGPAFNIVTTVLLDAMNDGQTQPAFGSLAVGSSHSFRAKFNHKAKDWKPGVTIKIEYSDLFGTHYEARRSLRGPLKITRLSKRQPVLEL